MELKNYIKKAGMRPTGWAKANGLPPAIVNRYLRDDGVLSVFNALRIEAATNEEVTLKDLLAKYKYHPAYKNGRN